MNTNKIYHNKMKSKKISRKFLYLIILLILICLSGIYEFYKYNKFIDTFKTNFNEYKFSEANNLLVAKQNFNPFKLILMNNDISKFFTSEIDTLSEDIKNNNIYSENALIELKEIYRYNIISYDELHNISTSIDLINDSTKNYTNGVDYFNNGQYQKAVSCFQKVSTLDFIYPESLIYLKDSRNKFKEEIFTYCDNLISNDHYNDALSKISENSDILGNDINVQKKIIDIKTKQQEYLDGNSAIAEASSRALTTNISPNNINTLNIESTTSYFVNVNLATQKTYIYKGKPDNWKLIRTCPCSTGISGEDTPTGSFSIKEKGDWFFSDKYEQGGKYWTQITGDILFHSVPFAKDKTTVLDYTMNKPSSHGCIRLSIDDAKWIYTTIPKGSKIIIK